ncbi:MAG: hypothetical protein ACYCPS_00020 [Candidatus Saccharimonadales bacterium]
MIEGIKFFGTATIGTKGQMVIPTEARKYLDLHEGDKIVVVSTAQKGGLGLIKAQALEELIQKMQIRQGAILKTAQNLKKMADRDN